MAPVIVAKDLYKCYPGFAPVLRGASLEVEAGEVVAIMGPSGCGKSTMLHILGLLHSPDSGSLEILGQDVLKLDSEGTAAFRRANLGFVMQSNNLFEHSTVFENVEFPLIYDNVPPRERWERVIRALELVRLSARVHYRGNRLSGGEQQRVAIARAMVNNPRILLADEPTGALDSNTSKLIMENFRRLCHSGGVSLVMVTHDPQMADYCDSVYTLEDGVLNRKKHDPIPLDAKNGENPLNPSAPIVRGVLVARRFPERLNPDLLELARHLLENQVLSQIYAISSSGFLENPEGYALSLPVRHVGWWQKLAAFRFLFHRARGSASLWHLWRKLPAISGPRRGFINQCKVFAYGTLISRWGLADNIQFLFASGARRPATVAWVASRLLRLPFGFTVRGRDLPHFNADWELKAKDATVIVCPTQEILDEFRKLLPTVDGDKILLVPNSLVSPPTEERQAEAAHGQNRAMQILAMGSWTSGPGFEAFLDACAMLKKFRLNFKISIIGPKTWRQRWQAWRRGLGGRVAFVGLPEQDALGVAYQNADIFAAWPPKLDGADLDLPWYLSQAMAYGLGIALAGAFAGCARIITPGKDALVVEEGDASLLAGALKQLVEDDRLREKLGNAARLKIMDFLHTGAQRRVIGAIVESVGLRERQEDQKLQARAGD